MYDQYPPFFKKVRFAQSVKMSNLSLIFCIEFHRDVIMLNLRLLVLRNVMIVYFGRTAHQQIK